MTRATRRVEHTGPTAQFLYLAFELGVEEWKLGFMTQCLAGPAEVTAGFARRARELGVRIPART